MHRFSILRTIENRSIQVSEAKMNIQEAYNEWSLQYDSDRNLTRDLDRVATETILANSRYQTILEIGCGTGKNTVFLSQISEQVYAIDFSVAMLKLAQEKLKSDNVSFSVADITKPWSYGDRSVDLVVCNLVLEHIEDLEFIFSEAYRSLVEEGSFFICELHPYRQYAGTKANFTREGKTIEIPAFVHHLSDFIEPAKNNGFVLQELKEWWHKADRDKPPRLVSFMFEKGDRSALH